MICIGLKKKKLNKLIFFFISAKEVGSKKEEAGIKNSDLKGYDKEEIVNPTPAAGYIHTYICRTGGH